MALAGWATGIVNWVGTATWEDVRTAARNMATGMADMLTNSTRLASRPALLRFTGSLP